jgi:hypothetical protein
VPKVLLSLAGLAAALFAVWIALTALTPGTAVATWAPCPRNWAWAPSWLPRASPIGSVRCDLDGVHAKLCYGRPSLRGRRMLGGEAVPYGRLWRTGANEPTTLHLDGPARLGPLALLPGSYSLYTVPGERAWQVVVNRSTRQWGLETEYDEAVRAEELGRFEVAPRALASPVETLTFRAERLATGAVDLVLEWERVRLVVPLVAGLSDAEGGEELF